MIPQLPSYYPGQYLPGSFGRYRQYPRSVDTPIPGAGYDVGRMAWAEQQLNLTANPTHAQTYGNYAVVPLRGLGDSGDGLGLTMTPEMTQALIQRSPQLMMSVVQSSSPTPTTGDQGGAAPTESPAEQPSEFDQGVLDVANQIEQAAAAAAAQAEGEAPQGFFDMKVGPVPVWALGLAGVAVVGGGAWWWMRRRKK